MFAQLLVRTSQQTHWFVPCAAALGFATGLWLVAARAERVVRGAEDGPSMRDWLAAVNDGVPANTVVMRPAVGFEIPKNAGSPLILIVMQDLGVVCPCNCCFKLQWFIRKKMVSHGTGAPQRPASFGPKTEASPCRWKDAVGASR